MYQYGVIDWTRVLMNPMIIGKAKNPSGLSYYGQNADMRYTVIIVAACSNGKSRRSMANTNNRPKPG